MTSKILRNSLLLLAALAVLGSSAIPHGRGQGNGNNQKDKDGMDQARGDQDLDQTRDAGKHKTRKHRASARRTVPAFGPRERDLIGGYHQSQYTNLPPGLAKRGGNLPPGLQKQLEHIGTLPPELQKRLQPFPLELSRQLPRLPANYTYGVIDGSAVIVNSRTRQIIDLIQNVMIRSGV